MASGDDVMEAEENCRGKVVAAVELPTTTAAQGIEPFPRGLLGHRMLVHVPLKALAVGAHYPAK
jgi:hypothetical protein